MVSTLLEILAGETCEGFEVLFVTPVSTLLEILEDLGRRRVSHAI